MDFPRIQTTPQIVSALIIYNSPQIYINYRTSISSESVRVRLFKLSILGEAGGGKYQTAFITGCPFAFILYVPCNESLGVKPLIQ